MDRLARIRDRYMRDDYPTRLGGLSANLARISSFSDDVRHRSVVEDLISESEHFIEWTTSHAELADQACLVELQLELARWLVRVGRDWEDESVRSELAESAKSRSDEILQMSGLLITDGSR